MKINYLLDCCGVKEISQLSNYDTPEEALRAFGARVYPNPKENDTLVAAVRARAAKNQVNPHSFNYLGAQYPTHEASAVYDTIGQYSRWRFAIFTEAHRPHVNEDTGPKYGQNFAALIRKCQLGDLVETGRHQNPNSMSNVKVWVWTVDWPAVTKWLKDDDKKRNKKPSGPTPDPGPNEGIVLPPPLQGVEYWNVPGTLTGEPGVNNQWEGNQTSRGIGTAPTVEGLGIRQHESYVNIPSCAPAPPRQD